MKQMLKIEMERAFRGAAFKVALAIGMIICVLQFVIQVLPAADNPLEYYVPMSLAIPVNVHYIWIGGWYNMYYTLYIRLIPLLAVIPYAVTFYTDNKKGIVRNYYVRTKKINYLLAKLIAVFLTGGFVATIPLLLNLIATSAVLPSIIGINGTISCNANGMWSYIWYSHPYVYYFMYLILQYICAGLLATISLVISQWVNNGFIVLLFPIVLCEFLNAVTNWSSHRVLRGMAAYKLLSIEQLLPNYWQSYVLFILIIIAFDVVFYLWRGVKNDTL